MQLRQLKLKRSPTQQMNSQYNQGSNHPKSEKELHFVETSTDPGCFLA
jgi:hypothetical protein